MTTVGRIGKEVFFGIKVIAGRSLMNEDFSGES